MKKILVVDNYDSFTFNLVQYCGEIGYSCDVYRNDHPFLQKLLKKKDDGAVEMFDKIYQALIISPGPCSPNQAGLSTQMVGCWAQQKMMILGVCLGHQCIAQYFGAKIVRAKRIFHGKISSIHHDGRGIFADIPNPFSVARYHSLAVKEEMLPDCLEISARDDAGEIMAVRHKNLPIVGMQFHPESIATDHGHSLLKNFFANNVMKKVAER